MTPLEIAAQELEDADIINWRAVLIEVSKLKVGGNVSLSARFRSGIFANHHVIECKRLENKFEFSVYGKPLLHHSVKSFLDAADR